MDLEENVEGNDDLMYKLQFCTFYHEGLSKNEKKAHWRQESCCT